MEKKILGQSVSLAEAPVHVAPGGSVLIKLTGCAKTVAKLLADLREEIAYGMADIKDVNEGIETVIYLGADDMSDFDRVFADVANISCEKSDLPEGSVMKGLSMQARNQIIAFLG